MEDIAVAAVHSHHLHNFANIDEHNTLATIIWWTEEDDRRGLLELDSTGERSGHFLQ